MTDSNKTKRGTLPTHSAYHVRGEGKNAFWCRIGSAWQHADNSGFNIQIETVPLNGRIVLRTLEDKQDQ